MAVAGLEHLSVLYEGERQLADLVTGDIELGLERDEAILVCLPEAQWEVIRRRLGTRADQVTYRPAGVRYDRPITAMSMLARFVDDALADGHAAVQSIGAIAFTGTRADTPWLRYEAAVNELFHDVPLRAVCLTDLAATPPSVLEGLHHVHHRPGHDPEATTGRHFVRLLPPSVLLPDAAPDVLLVEPTAQAARAALTAAFGEQLDVRARGDLHLVVSELVTNGQRHGAGVTTARAWAVDERVVVAVTDPGAGIASAAVGFRPAGSTEGGRGLWIVHQLCRSVDFEVADGSHTVIAEYDLTT